MSKPARHAILVRGSSVAAVRERIERTLGVKTAAAPDLDDRWRIEFDALDDIDLDFLRPDVLPPR
jgi:hypothetical protein